MLKKLLSVPRIAQEAKTNIITVRTLIDNGLVPGYVTDQGWRCGDEETVKAIKARIAAAKK